MSKSKVKDFEPTQTILTRTKLIFSPQSNLQGIFEFLSLKLYNKISMIALVNLAVYGIYRIQIQYLKLSFLHQFQNIPLSCIL
jgi:hypothetical protein